MNKVVMYRVVKSLSEVVFYLYRVIKTGDVFKF